jgi:hypothetical protein
VTTTSFSYCGAICFTTSLASMYHPKADASGEGEMRRQANFGGPGGSVAPARLPAVHRMLSMGVLTVTGAGVAGIAVLAIGGFAGWGVLVRAILVATGTLPTRDEHFVQLEHHQPTHPRAHSHRQRAVRLRLGPEPIVLPEPLDACQPPLKVPTA